MIACLPSLAGGLLIDLSAAMLLLNGRIAGIGGFGTRLGSGRTSGQGSCGLALSGMLDPAPVLGFLDVAGAWDPSLAVVPGGAVTVSDLDYALSRRRAQPAFEARFDLPRGRRIDAPLVLGAALSGVGWGLAGICPCPALAALSTGAPPVLVFVAAMLAGMAAHGFLGAARAAVRRA